MTTRVYIDARFEGVDEEGFFGASFNPIVFGGEDGDVLLAEVVLVLPRMWKHGRLVLALGIGYCGGVLLELSHGRPLRLSNISAWAWYGVSASAWYVVVLPCPLFGVCLWV